MKGLHWKLMADLLIQNQEQLRIRYSTQRYTSVRSPNLLQSIWILLLKERFRVKQLHVLENGQTLALAPFLFK